VAAFVVGALVVTAGYFVTRFGLSKGLQELWRLPKRLLASCVDRGLAMVLPADPITARRGSAEGGSRPRSGESATDANEALTRLSTSTESIIGSAGCRLDPCRDAPCDHRGTTSALGRWYGVRSGRHGHVEQFGDATVAVPALQVDHELHTGGNLVSDGVVGHVDAALDGARGETVQRLGR
jgi:hypothetical protein